MKSVTVRLPDETADRLNRLADRTRRTKSFYIRDILEKHLPEYEEAYLALERLTGGRGGFVSAREAEEQLP